MISFIYLIILVPVIEIYLFIKIGSHIGAFNTISLIFVTAIVGIYYAKYEGLNTMRSAMKLIVQNETPIYEIISGAALAFAAILMILPGFLTDAVGLLIIFPWTRKIFLKKISIKKKKNNKNFIEGEYEDIDEQK
ncbi:FxsA family protein [Candidatus Pelagibacter sp.]|jgi:Protein affecting phage T7 exclusion by the F plasmid|nr:FxsA family protein [Candidatus Pelagibacter sp.]